MGKRHCSRPELRPTANPLQGSTTHFDVVDASGNALSCTHSLGAGFGSGMTVRGTGITLNNFMMWNDMSSANPAAPKPGGRASAGNISCMSPMMIWDGQHRLRHLVDTPGSHGIPQTQTQLIMNLIDFSLPMQAAIEAPRVRLPETFPCDKPWGWLDVLTEARVPATVR